MVSAKNIIGSIILILLVSGLIFWFAHHQISLIFSVAAIGYPIDLWYVVLNFILIAIFVLLIGFRRKIERLPASIYLAFVAALYIEMYGFPLTMYFFSWAYGSGNVATLWWLITAITGESLFYYLFMGVIVPVSNVLILAGIFLVIFGWIKIFKTKERLQTSGIYKHIRHPQYLGFLTITLGMNVLWPTFTTIILWPILVLLYYRLAKEEDKKLEEKFGEEFLNYSNSVPMFIPKL